MEKVTANQAAKLLGISIDKLGILEKQGLIHSSHNTEGVSFYSSGEIAQIKSRRGPTLAEEAAQVGIEIQQEVFTSVSGLVKLRKRASILGAFLFAVFILLLIVITTLFYKYPLATSDFFGYYYRFNTTGKLQALSATAQEKNVLGVTTGPDTAPVKTSVLADVIKPVAATSLVLIKAVDNQKYQQITRDPFLGTGQAGPPGSQGSPGTEGLNGQPGLIGPQGLTGSSGSNGTNGASGSNGTSVADVLTTPGSLIIRNGTNTTVPLGAGSNGQVLTISGGIPAWESLSTTATNFSGSLLGDVTGTQGSTVLKSTGTAGTYGSATSIPVFTTDAQGRVSAVTNTAISGLTNANLSGSAGITNANLANSSVSLAGNSGSGTVSLGGTLTVTGSGITNITASGSTLTVTSTEADTLASVTGRGATTATALTLSSLSNAITAGTLTATGGTINGTTIGATTPSTGVFTTINGLTITNNGSNTLNIGAGKTFTVSKSITFGGTDGTTFTLPATSDTLIGRISTDTLTNKTIAAGSNTITGLTNSNLSGSAGITNANLANNSITISGNSGSGSVSLGGGLTFTGSGITNIVASGSTLTVTSTEADTLQSVYNRGNTIPTTTGSTANTIDSATINLGNIASTAQQNFSTLNIKNGGTGYLDIELIKGFINFQGMNTLYDDFTGNALDVNTKWNASPTGSGSSCDLLPGGLNGLLRMAAGGAANRRCELSTQATLSNGYYQRGNNPIAETKLKIDVTTNVRIFAGFTNTAPTAGNDTNVSTHHAYIEKLAAGTQFQCVTDNGGGTETTTSTGVTMNANTFYRLRVELRNGTTPETICTIDDGTTVTRTVVTATQPGATSAMDIYLKVETSNTTAKNMDVDYVRVWQDDPSPGLVMDNNSLPPIANDSVKIASLSATPSAILPIKEKVASDSGSLVELVANSVKNFFKNLVEFFGNVIFHANVTFLGRPIFNKDTAGHAFIKAGNSDVSVIFGKEYVQNPVVTASVNLVGTIKPDEVPGFAVYDLSTKGFKIKLSKPTAFDLNFSWIALAVNGDTMSTSGVLDTPLLSPTSASPSASEIPAQTVIPSGTPSPSSEITHSPTPTITLESTPSAIASPSAQVVP